MSVATEKEKPATVRFQLVRLKVTRAATLSSLGSSLYRYTFGAAFAFAGITLSGVTLTPVLSAPISNGQYLVDESTGTVTIYLSTPPTVAAAVSRYLFLTSDEWRYTYETPTDSGTTVRAWEPRLAQPLEVKTSVEDIGEGYLSFEASAVRVLNPDHWLESYIDPTVDTFFRQEVVAWQAIGTDATLQRILTGAITSHSHDDGAVTFTVYETTYSLTAPAYVGLTSDDLVYSTSTYEPHKSRVRPAVFAQSSWHERRFLPTAAGVAAYSIKDGLRAGCTDWTGTVSTSTARTWKTGWIKGTAATTQVWGGAATAGVTVSGYRYVKLPSFSNIYPGDTLRWFNGGEQVAEVVYAGATFNYLGTDYNLVHRLVVGGYELLNTITPTAMTAIAVFLDLGDGNAPLMLCQSRDYTVATTTSQGLVSYTITLANNFEATYSIATLDPTKHDLIYVIRTDADLKHGTVAQHLLEKAGLTVDTASITAANVTATDTTMFQIPAVDGGETPAAYRDYVGEILKSMLAYVYVTETGTVGYELYATPSATDVRDTYNIPTPSVSVETRDIATKLVFSNPHIPTNYFGVVLLSASGSTATALYGVELAKDFRHCLALPVSGVFSRAPDIVVRAGRPRVTYEWETATLDLDKRIGNDVRLTHGAALGGTGTVDLKIIGLAKGIDSVKVRATRI